MSGIVLAFVGGSYGVAVVELSGTFSGAPFAALPFAG